MSGVFDHKNRTYTDEGWVLSVDKAFPLVGLEVKCPEHPICGYFGHTKGSNFLRAVQEVQPKFEAFKEKGCTIIEPTTPTQ